MSSHTRAIDPERRKWQNPEAILADIGLRPGLTFADIGCGGGFFALPAARVVGESGKVYGVDTDSTAIGALIELANREGLDNIELMVGKAEDVIPCELCADIVFFGIVLHDFEDPLKVLRNAKKTIKPTGKLVDLDWKKAPMPLGPPFQKRFSQDEAREIIASAEFSVESIMETGPYQYLIMARP
jgi:ubiquinone/menaquinone biosynthesis C-methylase UbiE